MTLGADAGTYVLNDIENRLAGLSESLKNLRASLEACHGQIASLRDALCEARLSLDEELGKSSLRWQEMLRLADRCAMMPECPREICELVKSAFDRMGFTVYGLPGEPADDLASLEIVARQGGMGKPGTILQTLEVGLRQSDGRIVRYPRVVVAG